MGDDKRYEEAARKASADGHRAGSHAWWNALRFYKYVLDDKAGMIPFDFKESLSFS